MRKISAGTLSVNQGMLAIMNNCGMASDGIRKRHRLVDGEAVDVVHMALFAEQVLPPTAAESMRRPWA